MIYYCIELLLMVMIISRIIFNLIIQIILCSKIDFL